MNNKNKIKISAGLNYHLHKRTQEFVKEKNISLTYLVENALENFFEEQKKIDSNKNLKKVLQHLQRYFLKSTTRLTD